MAFTPDKLHQYIELINSMYSIVEGASGKLVVFMAFGKLPMMPSIHPFCLVFYDGSEEEARTLVAPLIELGPVHEKFNIVPYSKTTEPSPEMTGSPAQRYSTSNAELTLPIDADILKGLAEELGAFLEKHGAAAASSKAVLEVRSHAKSSSVPVSATALAGRHRALALILEAQYEDSLPDALMRQEVQGMILNVREKVKAKNEAAHRPDSGVFINANISSGTDKVTSMFGENLPKLRELKRKYDPNMVFNKWYPIEPAEA